MEDPHNPFSEVETEIESEEIEQEYRKYQRPRDSDKEKEVVEKERVSKLIAKAGIVSRRAAEELITEGRVSVNGHFIKEPGVKADPLRDKIVVDGRPFVVAERETSVLLFHKPKYVMTTRDDPGKRTTIFDILPKKYAKMHSVGRLDFETTGVLLITDDGELTHLLTHPSHGFEKVYEARVRGEVTRAKIDLLKGGIVLEDGKTAPCHARVIAQTEKNALVELTLREGKNRQVRRMFEAIGHPVNSLRRVKFAGIELEGLPAGEFRVLLPGEVKALRKNVENGLKKLGPTARPKPKPKIINDKNELNSVDDDEKAPVRKPAARKPSTSKPPTRKPAGEKPAGAKAASEKTYTRKVARERPVYDPKPNAGDRNEDERTSVRRNSSDRPKYDRNSNSGDRNGDRNQDERTPRRPSSDRPTYDRNSNSSDRNLDNRAPLRRSSNERPNNDRYANDKAPTRRPSGERPPFERNSNLNSGDRAPVRRPSGERPTNNRISNLNDRTPVRRPSSERPTNDRNSSFNERSAVRRPSGEKPPFDRNANSNERTPNRRPSNERPANDRTANEKPPVRRVASERPASDRNSGEKSPTARRIERKWKD